MTGNRSIRRKPPNDELQRMPPTRAGSIKPRPGLELYSGNGGRHLLAYNNDNTDNNNNNKNNNNNNNNNNNYNN